MKTYRAPGVYSRFMPAEVQAESGAYTRKIAIVGPGQKFFTKENVAVRRSSDGVLDSLPNENIIEMMGLYDCRFTNGKFEYTDGKAYTTYKIVDDKVLWLPVDEDGIPAFSSNYLKPAKVEKIPNESAILRYDENGNEVHTVGSSMLMQDRYLSVEIDKDANGEEKISLLKDSVYVVEITSTEKAGVYTVFNETTGELVGEFLLDSGNYRTDIIPGVKMRVAGTGLQDEESGEYIFPEEFSMGDSIKIKVSSPNNYLESSAFVNVNPLDRMANGSVAWFKNGSIDKFDLIVAEGTTDAVNRRLANIGEFASLSGQANENDNTKPASVKIINDNLSQVIFDEDTILLAVIPDKASDKLVEDNSYKLVATKYDELGKNRYVIQKLEILDMNGEPVKLPLPGISLDIGGSDAIEDLNEILVRFDAKLYKSEINNMLQNARKLDNLLFPINKKEDFVNAASVIFDQNEQNAPAASTVANIVKSKLAKGMLKDDLVKLIYEAIVDSAALACESVENVVLDSPLLIIESTKMTTLVNNVQIVKENQLLNYDYIIKGVSENEIQIYRVNSVGEIGTAQYSELQPLGASIEIPEGQITKVLRIPGISFEINRPAGIKFNELKNADGEITDLISVISIRSRIFAFGQPENNSVYYASYKYAKNDFEPKLFSDFDEIKNEYGIYSIALNGQVVNPVTLAAEIAFNNGAREVVICQTENNTKQAFKDAIDKLSEIHDDIGNIDIIIPLTSDWDVIKYLSDHVTKYSSEDYNLYRMGYVAASKTEPTDSDDRNYSGLELGSIQKAKSLNNERMIYVVPGSVNRLVTNSLTGYAHNRNLAGYFAAVAVACLTLRNDLAEPLTNKAIYGIDSLGKIYKDVEANKLANAGCLVLKQDKNVIKVRHGITTHYEFENLRDIHSNEITFVQVKDFVIRTARDLLGNNYVGNKLKPSIINDINYSLQQMFVSLINSEIILGYEGLSVKRDIENPMQINITFFIEAIYPLNFIEIKFGFSTTISE